MSRASYSDSGPATYPVLPAFGSVCRLGLQTQGPGLSCGGSGPAQNLKRPLMPNAGAGTVTSTVHVVGFTVSFGPPLFAGSGFAPSQSGRSPSLPKLSRP